MNEGLTTRGENRILRDALLRVVREFEMWAEDQNDGTYAYYRSDGLMMACVAAREALRATEGGAS